MFTGYKGCVSRAMCCRKGAPCADGAAVELGRTAAGLGERDGAWAVERQWQGSGKAVERPAARPVERQCKGSEIEFERA